MNTNENFLAASQEEMSMNIEKDQYEELLDAEASEDAPDSECTEDSEGSEDSFLPRDRSLLLDSDFDFEEELEREEKEEQKIENNDSIQEEWIKLEEGVKLPTWRKYIQKPGLSADCPSDAFSAIDFFSLLFDENIVKMCIQQTNLYTEQFFERNPQKKLKSFYKKWNGINSKDLRGYIAIIIHMGMTKLPRISWHWKKDPLQGCTFCSQVMSKNKFYLINTFLHLVNNREHILTSDPIYKIREFINCVQANWRKYYTLSELLCIDEKMIAFTGRSRILQYQPAKPTKWGFKVFALADALNGYIHRIKLYTGKQSSSLKETVHDTVLELVNGLEHRGHAVFFDNYYCSVKTSSKLQALGIASTGVIRKNAKDLPLPIKNPSKQLKKKEALYMQKDKTVAVVFRDKRDVRLLTNMYGSQTTQDGKPLVIQEYNYYARGVDKANQNAGYYRFEHRSKKWWKVVFVAIIELSIANAFQLFKLKDPLSKVDHLHFRIELIQQLVESTGFTAQSRRQMRLISGLHRINKRSSGKNCCICSRSKARKTTQYYCEDCDLHMHPDKCFYIYHAKP